MATEGHAAANAQGVSRTFPNGIIALNQVSVAIERGSITALVGRNGSGKTTLLKVLGGLLAPQSGAVQILGESADRPSRSMRSRVGYVSQAPELDPEVTGLETLSLFAVLFGVSRDERNARAEWLAANFGLTEHLSRPVAEYSGGLRQRLHLAIGFVHEPELLLLDEPTAALDPAGRAFVWDLLEQQRSQGRTVVVVTHDLPDVARHCQNLVLLQRGRVLATGSPSELMTAHAPWTLLIELTESGRDDATLVAQLSTIAAVRNVSLRQDWARLELIGGEAREAQATAERVLDFLSRQQVAVNSLRLHAPDLAGAYFRLTGEDLGKEGAPDAAATGEGRGARGKRGQRGDRP
jgi:ABC-2 type transport system ATP-binding protein